MKRYQIREIESNRVIASYEADEPLPHQPEWGQPARTEQAVNEDGVPQYDENDDPVLVDIPATYEVIETDITEEVRQRKRDQFARSREQQAESQILAALGNRQPVTILARAMSTMAVAVNAFGDATPEQQGAARAALAPYRSMFEQVEGIMAARDADIAAYDPDAEQGA
jgi:hypothetical protein